MACQRCNYKKVKCTGGDPVHNAPCRHCRSARADCIYPTRHKNVTVSESYLKSLENAVAQLQVPATMPMHDVSPPSTEVRPASNHGAPTSSRRRFIENTTGDAFVVRLKSLATNRADAGWSEEHNENGTNSEHNERDSILSYDYFSLPSDQPATNITLRLPPYPYAIHLVDQFETYMGYEYHWYLRKSFRAKIETTYSHPHSDVSKDRTWLCQLLVVLALGETYNSRLAPCIRLGEANVTNPNTRLSATAFPPPGVGFFNEAMSLFRTPFEEATTDHVEVLNLMAFYSYSLGRRKSAYVYSGLAIRIASMLMLQTPSVCSALPLRELEHRKRLWWTTYQLDTMTGYKLGLNSTYEFEELEAKIGLPTDDGLLPNDRDEFAPCSILTAHVRLCSIRSSILSVASTGSGNTNLKQVTAMLASPVAVLEEWRTQLPRDYSFDFVNGLPEAMIEMPECRSLASLYLRFHQCFILLLRPLLLRLLASIVTRASIDIEESSFDYICTSCMNKARQNLSVLRGLWGIDRIAKFGFWESLHLFSSIKVFLMVSLITTARPFSITYDNSNDDELYQSSKLLLQEMANVGNMSSRKHLDQLEELERTRVLISGHMQPDAAEGSILPDLDIDIDQWLAMLAASPSSGIYPT